MYCPIPYSIAPIAAPNLISRSPLRLAFILIPLLLICFALPRSAPAVTPPPDGGYPFDNTAEGTDALFKLTHGTGDAIGGIGNTAIGFQALYNNTTGNGNTANGMTALFTNTTGAQNTANGVTALYSNTTGRDNTADGFQALANNTTGSLNTASGYQALIFSTSGFNDTANGFQALFHNSTGSNNTATGSDALRSNEIGNNNMAGGFEALKNSTGSNNIALGFSAGINLTTGNNNIDIGALGLAGESDTIRIGRAGVQKAAYMQGISGTTVGLGSTVIVGSNGRLGTIQSSGRFKDEIKPMDKASEAILALKPVTFRYKQELDPDGIPQFGLVAEQVEKVNPDLVVRDEDGKVSTVRYEAVNAMLLNEFLKEHRNVAEQQSTIAELKSAVAKQQATNAQQQQQIEALTAGLQKVSAAVELNKPAPTQVADTR